LRLVEDDEGVVERAPAHVGERRDLDRLLLEHPRGTLEAEKVVERVVERPQVGIDLLREVAGQEAKALAGFHRGPRQHDALDRVALERVNRAGDGEIGLARSGRADAEGDVVRQDVAKVVALPGRTSAEVAAASVQDRPFVVVLAPRGRGALLGEAELDVLDRQRTRRRLPEAREHVARLLRRRRVALDAEALATARDARVEVFGDGPDVALDRATEVG